jgi:hypothetical protein
MMKTSKTNKYNNKTKKATKKVSKRLQAIYDDPNSVWGKNKPLETFWGNLAKGKYVVVVYKDGTHKYLNMPPMKSKKVRKVYDELDADPQVESVLSSNLSQDAYELYLYPKAGAKTSVEEVIKNYKTYFKPMGSKDFMKKVRVPL